MTAPISPLGVLLGVVALLLAAAACAGAADLEVGAGASGALPTRAPVGTAPSPNPARATSVPVPATEVPVPTAPGRVRAGGGGRALAIGDSVIIAAGPEFCDSLGDIDRWTFTIDASESRQLRDIAGLLDGAAAFDRVLIALGTNGPFDDPDLDTVMEGLEGVGIAPHEVVWITVQVPDWVHPHEAATNDVIRRGVDRWGARLADWNGATNSTYGLFEADGIHMNCDGARTYAAVIAGAL